MILNIFSLNEYITFYNIKIINIFNKNYFSIIKNHITTLCSIKYIFFYNKKIFLKINFKNGILFQQKNKIIIICDYYLI